MILDQYYIHECCETIANTIQGALTPEQMEAGEIPIKHFREVVMPSLAVRLVGETFARAIRSEEQSGKMLCGECD